MVIPYKIRKIETHQFAIFTDAFVNGNAINVETGFNFSISNDITHITCTSKVMYKQESNILLILELSCVFGIAPDGISEIKQENKVSMNFLQYMGSIVVGTARGVIHSKTEGTLLNPIVLPPINLVDLIKEDMPLVVK